MCMLYPSKSDLGFEFDLRKILRQRFILCFTCYLLTKRMVLGISDFVLVYNKFEYVLFFLHVIHYFRVNYVFRSSSIMQFCF